VTAKIFEMRDFPKGLRAANGVVFPELYRLEGEYFNLVGDSVEASGRKAPAEFVLSDEDARGLANPRWTPSKSLDPSKDAGWVVVRHHMKRSFVKGYFDALSDLTVVESAQTYQTKYGLFTLLCRPAPPNSLDHLLIYITKVQLHLEPVAGEWVDSWQIVHPDGSVTDDFDAIVPQYKTGADEGDEPVR
jgi:hypothetical protein